jgi:DNA-binding MarR family transcriptional regulator
MSDETVNPLLVETGSPLEQYERVMFTTIMLSMARALKDDNLSLAQVAALHLLEQKGDLRVSDIAEALGMQLSGASKVMADLVDRGLVARHDDPQDRRAKRLTVATAGKELILHISKRRAAEASFAMTGLEGEVTERFNRLFAAMFEAGLTRASPGNKG